MSEAKTPTATSKTQRADFASLEHLFGSKTRARLLSLFLHHPERKYFVRELSREVGAALHAVRRELDNLEHLMILKSEDSLAVGESGKKEKKKFYWIDKNAPIFPELQALVLKAELFIERNLAAHIAKLGNFYYVALAGRLCGGSEAPVDILLVGEADVAGFDVFLKHLNNEVGYDINYTLLSIDEFKIRKELTDRFLYAILEGKKTVLIDRLAELDVKKPVV